MGEDEKGYSDSAPLKKGLSGDIVGEMYLISSDDGMGHAFLMYQSFVNDTLNFSRLCYVYEQNTWNNATGKLYEIKSNEYITIGNSGDTDERTKELVFSIIQSLSTGNEISNIVCPAFSRLPQYKVVAAYTAMHQKWVGGVHINRELYNVSKKPKSYSSNRYTSRKITDRQLKQVIQYHNEHNYYIFATNNCSTVATGAWNEIYGEDYLAGLGYITVPAFVKNKLENETRKKNEINIVEKINSNENALQGENQ